MNSTTVIHNQTLLDIAIQQFGNVQAVFDLALANGLAITNALTPGQVLALPKSEYVDTDVLDDYIKNETKPATGITERDTAMQQELEGIDYWAIGNDFVVN